MRTSNAVLLVVALCTAVPSIKGQVPVNADPGLQKFFLVPESVLSQIPHQDKIIPIPQNIVSTAPGAVGGQPTFQSVQNSHQNPSRVALTPEQAEYARQQEAFRQSAIDANRRLVSQRKEQAALTNNQFSQNSAGQQFAQNDQFFDNQQHSQQAHQVHSQVQPVHAQTPARRVKPHRQKASQVVVPGQNQVSHQHRVHHQQVQQPLAQQQQQQYQQQVQQQQLRQPQVQQQQLRQPQVQQQFQQPQVQQQQFQQPQQQQFAPSAQPQVQPQPAAQRQVQQPAAPASSFISTQPSTESQRFKSQALRDEDEIIRHQAENAKYSFSSSVNDGINDQQHIRQETRDGLKLAGLYSYSDGFYKRTIHYEADENGYRVINEETEPIGNGPNTDPSGIAEVSSDVGGTSVRYSISGQDFPPQPITANEQFASNTFQTI